MSIFVSIEGFDGGKLFGQAFVLRKVSKFVVGGEEDAILPIPVFYDMETKKIINHQKVGLTARLWMTMLIKLQIY